MNKRNAVFFVQSLAALCLAIQVWVWLIYMGTFWLTGSLVVMGDLLQTVVPLKAAWKAFLVIAVPTLLVGMLVRGRLSAGWCVGLYVALGSLCGTLQLVYLSGQGFGFFLRQVWLYLGAGGLAGLVYGLISGMSASSAAPAGFSSQRRNLLGSLGLFAGGAGVLGSLFGPWRLWKNRDSYIDVNVSQLQEGEQVTVMLANKPVWIIKRSAAAIRLLEEENPQLLDPRSEFSQQPEQARNALRSLRPEYLIVYGLCTHLGCIPDYRPQGRAGQEPSAHSAPQFFCPCHRGVFDLAGRVYKNMPPPKNMVVPEHAFISEQIVRLYFPSIAQEWSL